MFRHRTIVFSIAIALLAQAAMPSPINRNTFQRRSRRKANARAPTFKTLLRVLA